MFNNKQYNWNNKESRAEKAKEHTEYVEKYFAKEIAHSCQYTTIFTDVNTTSAIKRESRIPEITVNTLDTASSVFSEVQPNTRLCTLNFASYKHPGGLFIEGSRAQEECLCHESILYNVLARFGGYYKYNQQNLNRALYTNRALYSQNILFMKNGTFAYSDVITCAAPNYGTAKNYCGVTTEENRMALIDRIRFVLKCAETMQADTLILGAYGAGVFGQNAEEVAQIFKAELTSGNYGFSKVVFSVIQNGDGNFEKMRKVLV